MSAVLTLPYVWATTAGETTSASRRPRPLNGLEFYRKHTERLLRRYMRASMAVGRVPSVIRDIKIRGKVSTYQLRNFEDVVVFVVDVDRCLLKLDDISQQTIVRIALQEYSYEEAADLMGISVRSTARAYAEALDRLTAAFLEKKLLQIGADYNC